MTRTFTTAALLLALAPCVAFSAAGPAEPCGFDPALGTARFAAWQQRPGEVMAVVNRAHARQQVCAASATDLELTRIEAALRAGLYGHAAASLESLALADTGARGRMALLMADLSYVRGRLPDAGRWLERARAGAADDNNDAIRGERARFLHAEVLRARGDVTGALALARELPAPLAAYATFNGAAAAWQLGQADTAADALDRLIGMHAVDVAGVDLRQRARLLRARMLLADDQAEAAAGLLDYIPQASVYARAGISLRAHAALAAGDHTTAARLAEVRGGRGVDALLMPYVLEQRGQFAAAHAGYRDVLRRLESELVAMQQLHADGALVSVRALATSMPDQHAVPRDLVAAFLAEPEVSELMLQVDGLRARRQRLDRVARGAQILGDLAGERNRRAWVAAERAAGLGLGERAAALLARVDAVRARLAESSYVADDGHRRTAARLDGLLGHASRAQRPDLITRIQRLQGRLLWELEWHDNVRRQQAAQRQHMLQARVAEVRARISSVTTAGAVAGAGGHDLDRFIELAGSSRELQQALDAGYAQALAALAGHFEHWLDGQLQDQRRAHGYAQLALARTADAMLVGQTP